MTPRRALTLLNSIFDTQQETRGEKQQKH